MKIVADVSRRTFSLEVRSAPTDVGGYGDVGSGFVAGKSGFFDQVPELGILLQRFVFLHF